MADNDKVPAPYFQDDEEGAPSDEGEGVDLMKSDGNLVGSGGEDSSDEDEEDDQKRLVASQKASSPKMTRRTTKTTRPDANAEGAGRRRESRTRRTSKSTRTTRTPRRKHRPSRSQVRRPSQALPSRLRLPARRRRSRCQAKDARPDLRRRRRRRRRRRHPLRPQRRKLRRLTTDDLPSVGNASPRRRRPQAPRHRRRLRGRRPSTTSSKRTKTTTRCRASTRTSERRGRQQRREEKRKARMSGSAADPAKAGIDREAWDEIHEIFGNGEDYYWALEDDDEDAFDAENKNKMEYKDIFEPAQIAERMLTEEDERIKRIDIQSVSSSHAPAKRASSSSNASSQTPELFEAAKWASTRISAKSAAEFLDDAGLFFRFRSEFLNASSSCSSYMLNDLLEVPFLFQHRVDDLEHLCALGLKFKTILIRKDQLRATFNKIHIDVKAEAGNDGVTAEGEPKQEDARAQASRNQRAVFEDMLAQASSLEEISDITEWLTLRYGQKMRDAQALASSTAADSAADDMDGLTIDGEPVIQRHAGFKKPSLLVPSVLAARSRAVALQVRRAVHRAAWGAQSPEIALAKAKMMLSQEIGKDPILKREIRQLFKDAAEINIEPTERGMTVIDDQHLYANFKFILNKPARLVPQQPAQYLQMLQAEDELLIKLDIGLKDVVLSRFENRLYTNYASEGIGEVSQAWNTQRREVIQEALKAHLVPNGRLWLKEWLREESRETLLRHCDFLMAKRLQEGPFMSRSMAARNANPKIEEEDRIPRVLAVSHGGGDPRKDVVQAVYLDERGRFREHATFDDLRPLTARQLQERELETERTRGKAEFVDHRGDFVKLLKQRRPDVVVVSGWSVRTAELKKNVRELVRTWRIGDLRRRPTRLRDRLRLHFERCIGCRGQRQWRRYQPGRDEHLPADHAALRRGSRSRKAHALVNAINTKLEGTLINRTLLLSRSILPFQVFQNCASFLRIEQDMLLEADEDDVPDVLDSTRIHPEDYELSAQDGCRRAQQARGGSRGRASGLPRATGWPRPRALPPRLGDRGHHRGRVHHGQLHARLGAAARPGAAAADARRARAPDRHGQLHGQAEHPPWDLQEQHRARGPGQDAPPTSFTTRPRRTSGTSRRRPKAKARVQARRQNRVIDQPNYHNFNYKDAVQFLGGQPRGSVVVRPSSKGDDHLAVTWKVDEGRVPEHRRARAGQGERVLARARAAHRRHGLVLGPGRADRQPRQADGAHGGDDDEPRKVQGRATRRICTAS
ncbi:hypothetical protein L1887_58500 [Cichorium endivia]|nr:hypothetical protein L1887_58500 [Cichorium endivia]